MSKKDVKKNTAPLNNPEDHPSLLFLKHSTDTFKKHVKALEVAELAKEIRTIETEIPEKKETPRKK